MPSSTGERQARHLDTLGTPSLHRLNPDGSVSRKVNGRLYVDPAKPSGVTDPAWDYLVWPTSTAHPAGVKTKDGVEVPPVASMALTGGGKGLKRKENSKLEAGPHDWISMDAKQSLSYDHGHGFRYAMEGAYQTYTGAKWICRKGVKIKTEFGVKGAAVVRVAMTDGSVVQRVIYAAYFFDAIGAIGLRLYYLDEANKDDDGVPASVQIASWTTPVGTVIAQPSFFSGDGHKMVTVLETVTVDEVGGLPTISFGRPRYAMRCELSLDGAGELSAVFGHAPLTETPDVPTSTTNEQLFGPGGDHYFTGNPKEVSSYLQTAYTGLGLPYTAAVGYVEQGYSRTTTTARQVRFVGLDLDAEGNELLLERVTDTRSISYGEEGAQSDSTDSATDYAHPDGYNTIAHSASYTYSGFIRSGSDASVKVAFTVNGVPLYEVATSTSSAGSLRTVSNSYSRSWVTGLTPIPPAPSPSVVDSVYDTTVRHMFSLRDADARNRALALVVGEHPSPFNGTDLRPLKVALHAQCQGHTFTKNVFDGHVLTAPDGAATDMFLYRAIASRRPGEFVICFSPDDTPHADPLPDDPADLLFFNHLAATGLVDRDPLFALRREDKVITPAPNKFALDAEPGFRLDPIHVL